MFDLLLQALGDSRLTDASGRTAASRAPSSSSRATSARPTRSGVSASSRPTPASLADHYLTAIRRHFAPELVNRIEQIIPFAALGAEPLRRWCRLQVKKLRRRRGLSDIELSVSDAALDLVAARGTTAEYRERARCGGPSTASS